MSAPYIPNQMFLVNPKADTESLLANVSESLASATVMLGDFAALLGGTHRETLLGIAQVVMLGELAVNEALDNVDVHRITLVGVSLLAIASVQPTSSSTGPAPSRAGSLLQLTE
ncbi:hypothetical protein J3D48_005302 [Pseudomonas fluorescens]|jgi:hypothetical protein|nr:hypothetical protein [Pseudomonas fluorescens]